MPCEINTLCVCRYHLVHTYWNNCHSILASKHKLSIVHTTSVIFMHAQCPVRQRHVWANCAVAPLADFETCEKIHIQTHKNPCINYTLWCKSTMQWLRQITLELTRVPNDPLPVVPWRDRGAAVGRHSGDWYGGPRPSPGQRTDRRAGRTRGDTPQSRGAPLAVGGSGTWPWRSWSGGRGV